MCLNRPANSRVQNLSLDDTYQLVTPQTRAVLMSYEITYCRISWRLDAMNVVVQTDLTCTSCVSSPFVTQDCTGGCQIGKQLDNSRHHSLGTWCFTVCYDKPCYWVLKQQQSPSSTYYDLDSDSIWRHRSGSAFTQGMACSLMAPNHYLAMCQCWLIICEVQSHSSESNFTKDTSAINN